MTVIHQELLGKGPFLCCRDIIAAVNPQDEERSAGVNMPVCCLRSDEPAQDVNIVSYPIHSFAVGGKISSQPLVYNYKCWNSFCCLR